MGSEPANLNYSRGRNIPHDTFHKHFCQILILGLLLLDLQASRLSPVIFKKESISSFYAFYLMFESRFYWTGYMMPTLSIVKDTMP